VVEMIQLDKYISVWHRSQTKLQQTYSSEHEDFKLRSLELFRNVV